MAKKRAKKSARKSTSMKGKCKTVRRCGKLWRYCWGPKGIRSITRAKR